MLQLEDMQLLRALGGSRSLAATARLLDLTPPAVTVRLQRIEQRMGMQLATRAARGISLTDEGQRIVQEAIEILERIESIASRVSGESSGASGHLRVVAPFGFGREYVAPLVRDLRRSHPNLAISLVLVESPLAAASGADAVISIGRVKGSSWVGHFLAPNERFLCASPALARSLSRLKHPSELNRCEYLALRENDEDVTRLRFTQRDAVGKRATRSVTIRLDSALSSNESTLFPYTTLFRSRHRGQGLGGRRTRSRRAFRMGLRAAYRRGKTAPRVARMAPRTCTDHGPHAHASKPDYPSTRISGSREASLRSSALAQPGRPLNHL